jgi:hypothetical protein
MIRGFIPDFAYGSTLVSSWHEGAPQKSFWRKTKVPVGSGIPMEAFRCPDCGYLELYVANI